MSELADRVARYIEEDVDPKTQEELRTLLKDLATNGKRSEAERAAARGELEDRFSGPLRFGTAGLRGIIGGGESRMNRVTVIRATYGLVQHVLASVPDAKERGLVIGCDGRTLSEQFRRDAAEVCAGLGVKVHLLPGLVPTPLVAFGVKKLSAAAGVMVTASHNPPQYNGYKVYWDNGAQIIPPHDSGIAKQIEQAPPANEIIKASRSSSDLIGEVDLESAYLDAILAGDQRAPVADLSVAYSAMHGVGENLLRKTFARRGITKLHSVAEQAQPDGTFPTVRFPNPEEPGALDLVLALAKRESCDVVLVNDPDADRLGVAVFDPSKNEYVKLSGNEIGVLLGHHLVETDHPDDPKRLVATTIVSSQLLKRIAEKSGIAFTETLTGFKWIANDAMRLEAERSLRFLFGYEEALGYTVGTVVRDKDGISAALTMAEIAADEKAANRTLLDRLRLIHEEYGLYLNRQKSLRYPGRDGPSRIASGMAALRNQPPRAVAGIEVAELLDLEAQTRTFADGRTESIDRWSGNVIILELKGGGRICVRPSGTEPKIKFYLEVVEQVEASYEGAKARGEALLDALVADIIVLCGLGTD